MFPRNHRGVRGCRNRGSTNGTREHTGRHLQSRARGAGEWLVPLPVPAGASRRTRAARGAAARRGCEGRRSAARPASVCVWENGEWMEMAGRASLGLGVLALGVWSLDLEAQQRYGQPRLSSCGKVGKYPSLLCKSKAR